MLYNLDNHIHRARAQKRFNELMEERIKIDLTKKVKRSLNQNSYLHLIIGYYALETGYTAREAKIIYKKCSPSYDGYKGKNRSLRKPFALL